VELCAHDDIFTGMNSLETMEKWIQKRNETYPEFVQVEESEAAGGPPTN